MFRRWLPIFLAIISVTAMSVSVWAKSDSGKAITASIRLLATTNIGATKLAPGQYKVTAEGTKATFERGNKVVAEVPCTLKDFPGKIKETIFIMDHNQMTEIQVSGKTKTIDFSSGK
jgi:hypothetical protein